LRIRTRDEKLPGWAFLGSHKIEKGYGGKYFEDVKVDQSFLSTEKVSTRRQINVKTSTLKPSKRKRKSDTPDSKSSAKIKSPKVDETVKTERDPDEKDHISTPKRERSIEIPPLKLKGVFDPHSSQDTETERKKQKSPELKKKKIEPPNNVLTEHVQNQAVTDDIKKTEENKSKKIKKKKIIK
jgi:hypothetical protein